MNILVTGGAGYIGSHTIIELINAKHSVTVVDNLSNSSAIVIDRIEQITGVRPHFHKFDLENTNQLNTLFNNNSFEAVIHFAGLKAVGESVKEPLLYYRTNIDATLSLLEVMNNHSVEKLVFSSSATVYGSAPIPYNEESPVGQGITSPYGQTKYMIEQILKDTASANPHVQYTLLRYFNPIGAHESGLIGENPSGVPNNLMPFIAQVAVGKREKLAIFGNDYKTPDGTCLRDYIHVVDLARGHVAALEHLQSGAHVFNLGSGVGTSVLELVKTFASTTGRDIPYSISPRRDGDLPAFWADPEKAVKQLKWGAEKTVEDMCRDTWRWQSNNPDGYLK
jgi:UDP-glucose 4-epimerase